MSFINQLQAYFERVVQECVLGLSLDCIILGHDTKLKVLLLRWRGTDEKLLSCIFQHKPATSSCF